jgi:hypothetical protein
MFPQLFSSKSQFGFEYIKSGLMQPTV